MKQLEKTYQVSYRWWRADGKPMRGAGHERLRQHALNHIRRMWNMGYESGELVSEVSTRRRRGVQYRGHWKIEVVG